VRFPTIPVLSWCAALAAAPCIAAQTPVTSAQRGSAQRDTAALDRPWPTGTFSILAYDPATYTHVENGVTFVEGCEPDHRRVIVAYPGPNLLRRELIASRFRGH